jgi:benzoate-CoA ligase family protein
MDVCPERYNVSTLLDANLEAGRGDKVAIYCGDQRVSYGELFGRVCAMGRALRSLGVQREQRVLLFLDDTSTFPVAFFGALRIGAVPVPVNPLFKVDDYRFFLEDTGAGVAVTEQSHLDRLNEALAGNPEGVKVIVAGESRAGTLGLDDLLAEHRGDLAPANTHCDDIAFWLYSSGSTGRPKGVVHLHRDVPYTVATYAQQVLGIREDDIMFSRVLYHAYGLGNCLMFTFSAGASVVLLPVRPSPQSILEAVQRFRPTLFGMVPTLYNAILHDPASAQYDLSSIRLCISAAEPLPPDTYRRWLERYGLGILDGIGSTEMLHIFCSNAPNAVMPGSTGRPVPGYELRLEDPDGNPVPDGEPGNLFVKGNSAAPFYWRQREKSRRTFRGEWVATGDRYRRDADG